jgi:hypothetical protein
MRTILIMLCILCLLSACGSSNKKLALEGNPPPEHRPDDLAIAATVFSPRTPLPDVNLPRSIRPARYIIEADGVLRASQGTEAVTFPSRVRQLSPRQADQLWEILLDSGLLDEGNPNRVSDPESAVRSGDRTTAMIFISYGGKRSTLRVLLDRATPDSIAAEKFIDRLAQLAWVAG